MVVGSVLAEKIFFLLRTRNVCSLARNVRTVDPLWKIWMARGEKCSDEPRDERRRSRGAVVVAVNSRRHQVTVLSRACRSCSRVGPSDDVRGSRPKYRVRDLAQDASFTRRRRPCDASTRPEQSNAIVTEWSSA